MLFNFLSGFCGCASFSSYTIAVQGRDEEQKAAKFLDEKDAIFETKVKPGMTKSEVSSILGDPSGQQKEDVWFYEYAEGDLQVRYYLHFTDDILKNVEKRFWQPNTSVQGVW